MQTKRTCLITAALLITALLFQSTPTFAAVTLASLKATATSDTVRISWVTSSEVNTVGFYVQRSLQRDDGYARISDLIYTQGDMQMGAAYFFDDTNVETGVLYYYYLEVFNSDQTSDLEGPVWSGPGLTPTPSPSRAPSATITPSPTRSPTATRRPSLTATRRPPTATTRPAGPGPIATWTIPPLPTSAPSATSAPPPAFRPTSTSMPQPSSAPRVQPSAPRALQPTATPSSAPLEEGGEPPVVDLPPGEDAGEPPAVDPPQTFPTTPSELGSGVEPPLVDATAETGLSELPGETPMGEELPGEIVTEPFDATPTAILTAAQEPSVEPASGAATAVAQAEGPASEQVGGVETVRAADGDGQQPETASYADRMRQALLALIGLLLAYQVYRFYRSARQRAE